jgi:hypothetical protein
VATPRDPDDTLTRFEFRDDLLRDGFTSMPNTVLYYRGISMGAKATYLVLLSYAWHTMKIWAGQEAMAEHLGISRPTLRKYLAELTERRLITITRRGQGRTSVITFERLGHL